MTTRRSLQFSISSRGRLPAASLLASALFVLGWALLAPISTANAGEWAQVSCSLAGKPVSTEGWSSGYLGGPSSSSGTYDGCDKPGGALEVVDISSGGESQVSGMGSRWGYAAPTGSTIAGGSLTYTLKAPRGTVYMATPEDLPDASDLLLICTDSLCGYTGEPNTVSITHTGGTGLSVDAFCKAPAGEVECPTSFGVNAEVAVFSADIALQNNSTPTASGLAGTLLQSTATGTAHLAFQALDPNGPGVYKVTAKLDGSTFYSATPASNEGNCAVLGTDSSGVREFQSSQPCPTEVPVSIELDTSTIVNEDVPRGVELEVAVLPPRPVVLRPWRVRNRSI